MGSVLALAATAIAAAVAKTTASENRRKHPRFMLEFPLPSVDAPECSALYPEPFEQGLVPSPARAYLHLQLEEDGMPYEQLDLGARALANLANHRTALSDHNLFLRLGLDEDARANNLACHLFDFDRDRMWELIARDRKRLLPHELGDLHVDGKIGPLAARKIRRTIREQRDELVAQVTNTLPGLRAHGMQCVEVPEPRRRVHLGGDVAGLQAVDLVQDDHDGNAELEHALGDEPISCADSLPRRQHEENAFDVLESRVDGALHALRQRVQRSLKSRQIRKHELVVVAVRDAED